MKLFSIACLAFITQLAIADDFSQEESNHSLTQLQQKKWIHGSPDCQANEDPQIDIFQYDRASYILRQNKCTTYEAPFIYVMVGDKKTVVVDSGATESDQEFPLYKTIQSIHQKHQTSIESGVRDILVLHTHSHSDHYGADKQFKNQDNVTVVGTSDEDVNEFFAFDNWPKQQSVIDLGGRKLIVISTPGHQDQAISIYDTSTQWLLTGDTFYPGYVYVKEWDQYRSSINTLVEFAAEYPVSAVMGAHIEMKDKPGKYYDIGTTYQPNESPLPLLASDLVQLNEKLKNTDEPQKIKLNSMFVEPLGALPKLIGKVVGWFM